MVGNEVQEGAELNEAAIKEVTGDRETTACRKYEHPFKFKQTAKIWFTGNHEPVVAGTDKAIWDRIAKVEFPNAFDKTKNTDIRERLLAEGPGILNWLVAGCLHAQRKGNPLPRAVRLAVKEYREEEEKTPQEDGSLF
jgi:putative DNA primase/helicase